MSSNNSTITSQPDDDEGAVVASTSDECAIVALLPFTTKGTKSNTEFSINLPIDHMAATLMAIDHFNTRNPAVVSDLASDLGRNVKLQ